MSGFAWLPRIGHLAQPFEQPWQRRSERLYMARDRLQTRRLFFRLGLVRAFLIREAGAGRHTQPLGLLLLPPGPLRPLAGSALLLDRFATGTAATLTISRRVGLITHGKFCGRHRRSQPIHWSRAARALAAPASKTQPLIWGWNGTILNASFPCARTCPAATLFTIPVKSYNRTCGSASGVNCA